MLSSGKGYSIYGLTLASSTMCALQGFWNFIVYARPRGYLTREILSNVKVKAISFYRRMSSNLGENNRSQEMTGHPSSGATAPVPVSNLNTKSSVTETVFIPFEAPGSEASADESAIGDADIQEPNDEPNISYLGEDQTGANKPEPHSDAADQSSSGFDGTDTQDPNDECNITSPVEEQIEVNEPEHSSDSKRSSGFRPTVMLMDLRKRLHLTNETSQMVSNGGGLDPAITRQGDDDAGGIAEWNEDEEELFEMLLAG
jgi:hypothetical protein